MSLTNSAFTLALAVLSASIAAGGDGGAEKLHGNWVGKAHGRTFTLTFGPKNVVKIRVDEDTAGEGTYSVDWSKRPAHLDIDWGKQGKVKTIIQLADDNLKIENAEPGKERPKTFTKGAMTLKRDKAKQ